MFQKNCAVTLDPLWFSNFMYNMQKNLRANQQKVCYGWADEQTDFNSKDAVTKWGFHKNARFMVYLLKIP